MARNEENLKGLYETLKSEGYSTPEYEEFAADMEDDDNLRQVYNTLKKEGYTPPAYDEFRTDMFGSVQGPGSPTPALPQGGGGAEQGDAGTIPGTADSGTPGPVGMALGSIRQLATTTQQPAGNGGPDGAKAGTKEAGLRPATETNQEEALDADRAIQPQGETLSEAPAAGGRDTEGESKDENEGATHLYNDPEGSIYVRKGGKSYLVPSAPIGKRKNLPKWGEAFDDEPLEYMMISPEGEQRWVDYDKMGSLEELGWKQGGWKGEIEDRYRMIGRYDRSYDVQIDGQDAKLPIGDVELYGDIYGWAEAHPEVDLKMYMKGPDGTTYRVPISEVREHRGKDKWRFVQSDTPRGENWAEENRGGSFMPLNREPIQYVNMRIDGEDTEMSLEEFNAWIKEGGYSKTHPGVKAEVYMQSPKGDEKRAVPVDEQAAWRQKGWRIIGNKHEEDWQSATFRAISDVWADAEAKYKKDAERNAERHWGDFAGGREMRIMNTSANTMDNMVSHFTRFDLKHLMDETWKRNEARVTESCYYYLKQQYPEANDREVWNKAKIMGRQMSDQQVFEYAKAKNVPKDVMEYFMRQVMESNTISMITRGLARVKAGDKTGDLAAYEQATAEYGKDHRAAQVLGTGIGMATDPTVVFGSTAGKVAYKTVAWLGGKFLVNRGLTTSVQVGTRYFLGRAAGKYLASMGAGAGNLMFYEGVSEAARQFQYGGHINPETGENEGYNLWEMTKSTGRGAVLGLGMGALGTFWGNAGTKWTGRATSTAGKATAKYGSKGASFLTEGAWFAVPGIVLEGEEPVDALVGSYATLIGIKAPHMAKKVLTAKEAINRLRPIKPENGRELTREERIHNMKSWQERWFDQRDKHQDISISKEDIQELEEKGYKLSRVLKGNRKDIEIDPKTGLPTFDGYEEMARLVEDTRLPQELRAKLYYLFSERRVAEPTVTSHIETENEDGTVTVETFDQNGDVITRRRLKGKELTAHVNEVERQVELNTIDIGEQRANAKARENAMRRAADRIMPKGYDFEEFLQMYADVKSGKDDYYVNKARVKRVDELLEQSADITRAETAEGIREAIEEDYDVKIEEIIKKSHGRSDNETDALEAYIKALYPEEAARQERMEEAQTHYEEAGDIYDRFEGGEPGAEDEADTVLERYREAFNEVDEAFGEEAEEYWAQINADPFPLLTDPELTIEQQDAVMNYINARAAFDGIRDRADETITMKRQRAEEEISDKTHKDTGMIQGAVMTFGDREVYIVKGNVQMFSDGSGIDKANSDSTIVIKDKETGELQFASPDRILRLTEPIDPAEELRKANEALDEEQRAVNARFADSEIAGRQAAFGQARETAENIELNRLIAEEELAKERQKEEDDIIRELEDEEIQAGYDAARTDRRYIGRSVEELNQEIKDLENGEKADEPATLGRMMWLEEEIKRQREREGGPTPTLPRGGGGETLSGTEAGDTPLSRIPVDEATGEPKFEEADAETAWDGLAEAAGSESDALDIAKAQLTQAETDLETLRKKAPKRKEPKLTGSPMAMAKAKREAAEKYEEELETYNQKLADAQGRMEAWQKIIGVPADRQEALRRQAREEQRQRDAAAREKAQAEFEEQQRLKAEQEAEQTTIGTHAVHPKIKEKWDNAPKVEGNADVITLPDGSQLRGRYVLVEAGTATASHDIDKAYAPTEGFPIDENGQSVNDRDYQSDRDAQGFVEKLAADYDNRALQDAVVVSKDGIVLSGNNRTMSGDLAARQGTDTKYVEYLKEFGGKKYGFTPEQISKMEHPRVVFVPEEDLAYDAATFSRFNAREEKARSKPEEAVAKGKTVSDEVFNRIVREIGEFDTLSKFYSNESAVARVLGALMEVNAINDKDMPQMRTGTTLSPTGKEVIENVLIGKAFQSNPDAVRMMMEMPGIKQSVVFALSEIATNRTYAEAGYDLTKELAGALDLIYRAKKALGDSYKEGMSVALFGRMAGLFDDEFGVSSVTDATTLLLADVMNSKKDTDLRKWIAIYNKNASEAAGGQMDIFAGAPLTKEEILTDINETLRNATTEEQRKLVEEAIADRERRAAEQRGGDEGAEQAETGVADKPADEGPVAEGTAPADPLTEEAKSVLEKKGLQADEKGRAELQRHFQIGYNRANRIIDEINKEAAGQPKEPEEAQKAGAKRAQEWLKSRRRGTEEIREEILEMEALGEDDGYAEELRRELDRREAEQAARRADPRYRPYYEELDKLQEANKAWMESLKGYELPKEERAQREKEAHDAWREARETADKEFDKLTDEELTALLDENSDIRSAFGRDGLMEYSRTADRLKEMKRAAALKEQWDQTPELPTAPTEGKSPKGAKMADFTAPKSEPRETLKGVYHDGESGFAVATDTHILVASKEAYDSKKAGKLVTGSGKSQKEEPLGERKYPNFRRAIPTGEAKATAPLTVRRIAELEKGLHEALKGIESKNDREQATVMVRMPGGETVGFNARALERFLSAARMLGNGNLEYWGSDRPISVRGANGAAVAMPTDVREGATWRIDLGTDGGTKIVTEPGGGYGRRGRSITGRSLFDWRSQAGQQSLLDLMDEAESTPGAGTNRGEDIFAEAERITRERIERRMEEAGEKADKWRDRFQEEYAEYRNELLTIDEDRERERATMADISERLKKEEQAEAKGEKNTAKQLRIELEEAEERLALLDKEEADLDERFGPKLERMEQEFYEYYRLNNTEADARAISKEMAQRAMAEVEIRARELHRRKAERQEAETPDEAELKLDTPKGLESPSGQKALETRSEGEVKTAGGKIRYEAAGHLPDAEQGEFAYAERVFTLSGKYSFTGGERVRNRGDVAFMFKALQTKAIENLFAVIVDKEGRPHVVHLSMGATTATVFDIKTVVAAFEAFKGERVYILHNHPSGNLRSSVQDESVMEQTRKALGEEVEIEGLIIDTTSGKYANMYSSFYRKSGKEPFATKRLETERVPESIEEERQIGVHEFDETDRSIGEGLPAERESIKSAQDVVNFISGRRFNPEERLSYLVISQSGEIVGNFHSEHRNTGEAGFAEEITSVAIKHGGESVIVYGKVEAPRDVFEPLKAAVGSRGVRLLDVVGIKGSMATSKDDVYRLNLKNAEEPSLPTVEEIKAHLDANRIKGKETVDFLLIGKDGRISEVYESDYKDYTSEQLAEDIVSTAKYEGAVAVVPFSGRRVYYEDPIDLKGNIERKGLRVLDILGVDDRGISSQLVAWAKEAEAGYGERSSESIEGLDSNVRFSIRREAAPRKTGVGYKVFVLKDGKLYPPMVANPGGEATPVGVWLNADAAPVAGQSKTGRSQVKAGGKGTQGGSGKLAFRPGWHLGEIPYALQFNRKGESGARDRFPGNFVWAEVEYADDVDYQDEAMSHGMNASGKFQHSLAGLPRVPENGSYRYRTNPNPETDPWIITGAMRVRRLLTPSEVDSKVRAAGREPQRRQEGALTDGEIERLNAELGLEGSAPTLTATREMAEAMTEMARATGVPVEIITDKEAEAELRRSRGDDSRAEARLPEGLSSPSGQKALETREPGRARVCGYTKEGRIYLNRDAMGPDTPLHEYTHLWNEMVRRENPELWERGKALLKETPEWREVTEDPEYADIRDNEDAVADEVYARYSGRRGAERMEEMVREAKKQGPIAEAEAVTLVNKLKRWLKDMFKGLKKTLGKWTKRDLEGLTLEEFNDMTLRDFAEGLDPNKEMRRGEAARRVMGKNPMHDDYHTGVRGREDVKTFDEILREAERMQAEDGGLTYPDVTLEQLRKAKESGRITVYSSKPIEEGVFVTPSEMNARDYAGGGRVYSKEVSVNDVAWIDDSEGQLAMGSSAMAEGKVRFQTGRGPEELRETIDRMKAEAAQANGDDLEAKREAMRAIGGNLSKLRQAMARQREYDVATARSVTDLARVMLEKNLLDDLSKYETKRILGTINKVIGKEDVSKYVQNIMDIMVDNQLRGMRNAFSRLLTIRGSRVDARGVEVQGQLDPEGQAIARVIKKSYTLPKAEIEDRMAEALNRMGDADQAIADEAALEYAGLQTAMRYAEDITGSKAEEKALRDSLKEAKQERDAGRMTDDAYKQYVEATEEAIRQNKIERAEAYRELIEETGEMMSESIERAKAWREAERERVAEIHHNANSDMQGRPTDEHHKNGRLQKLTNNSGLRFLFAPLGTFDQMLRMFGNKSARGEGYLWNRYMRGWVDATEKEYKGYQDSIKELDEKVAEVFSKDGMKWRDLFALDRKLPKMTVNFWDGGDYKDHELSQGNLLYIYMAEKMADGRMKLRRMGITEEDVMDIEDFLDPRFIELADWMQEEFLVGKRNKYNETHKRVYGASMAAIENYFPLKILSNARTETVEDGVENGNPAMGGTLTGGIIKRRRNNLALDVTGANAFSVILDHLQEMERWNAFAEFSRDLNTLLSYKRFRNQVMNMSSVYGGGKKLWKAFNDVCAMAKGTYSPPIAVLDKTAVNIAKGVTAAKVSLRVFTALKQFLSMPAYLSDSNPVYIAKNIANPYGAWKWAMENLPIFEKRWKSKMAGDPRLLKTEMDWKAWRSNLVQLASKVGMSPNAFVDALTVSIGAHSMYETKKAKYLRWGMSEADAERRAKHDATILFNQTQQSSESAFLSTVQVDRSWLSVLLTVFRNSSMSYTRRLYDSMRNLGRRMKPGYYEESVEFMAKQMRREGIDPDIADKEAKREYRRGAIRDLATVGVFGYGLQLAWNLGAYLPYLLLGDDDEQKDEMLTDAATHAMFGSVEGLTAGDVWSMMGHIATGGDGFESSLEKDMPMVSDMNNIRKNLFAYFKSQGEEGNMTEAMNDIINLLVQSSVGVNPQSLTDAVVAIMDYCGDDAQGQRECALMIARILNCPPSQMDKIYFDEIDATAREASEMTPAEIAERYARYKMRRNAPLTGWLRSEETAENMKAGLQKEVLGIAKEKITEETDRRAGVTTKELDALYEELGNKAKAVRELKATDRRAGLRAEREWRKSAEYGQYRVLQAYRREVKELTEEWLRGDREAKAAANRGIQALKERLLEMARKGDWDLREWKKAPPRPSPEGEGDSNSTRPS